MLTLRVEEAVGELHDLGRHDLVKEGVHLARLTGSHCLGSSGLQDVVVEEVLEGRPCASETRRFDRSEQTVE